MRLITVFQSFDPITAQLVWSQLDAAGFPAEVAHELSALSTEGYSMATGGVRVQVPEDRADEARLFLNTPITT